MSVFDPARGERVPDEVLEKLRGVTTATAWMYLQRRGVLRPFMMGVRPLSIGEVFPLVGRARTLRYVPLREDLLPMLREAGMDNPQREAIEAVEPGDVFVVDAMGNMEAATMGDILASRIVARGATGIVADGCVRDSPFIKRMPVPVYTRSVHPAANLSALLPYSHNDVVQCGGVTVVPGDILLGDEEGVVVIPAKYAAEIAENGPEREAQEIFQREKIAEGHSIADVYPVLNDQFRAEYEKLRASR
jgi:5-oxopent-3-ene-1,2,5-tricarboxylate decarboxylase / 2-hydroxyhepta-2,4-diene-1,7-dioate isomerase